jgi:hypothetical protein
MIISGVCVARQPNTWPRTRKKLMERIGDFYGMTGATLALRFKPAANSTPMMYLFPAREQ